MTQLPDDVRAVCPFRLVVDEDLPQLRRELTAGVAEAGATLFEEGDPAGGVFAVVEGRVEVVTQGRVLGTLGPGSVLGELSLFTAAASRTATVRAATPVRLLTWQADDVRGRLDRHERLATSVVADMAFVLAERLDRRTHDLVQLLRAAGSRLPVSELERYRSRTVQ